MIVRQLLTMIITAIRRGHRIDHLKDAIRHQNEQINCLHLEGSKLIRQIEANEISIRDLNQRLADKQDEINKLKLRVRELEENNKNKNNEIKGLNLHVQELEKVNNETNKRITLIIEQVEKQDVEKLRRDYIDCLSSFQTILNDEWE